MAEEKRDRTKYGTPSSIATSRNPSSHPMMPNPSARQNFFDTSANHPPQPPAVPQPAMAFLAQPVAVLANPIVLPTMEGMLSEKNIYVV